MNIDRFTHPDLKVPTTIGIGLGAAIGLGIWAGNGDFSHLKLVAVATILLVYILFFLSSVWILGILICTCSFVHVGFGFTMGEVELSLGVAGIFFLMTSWRKKRLDRPPILDTMAFGALNTCVILWLAYVFGHTVFNIVDPYRPAEYALKNLLKSVEAWTGPILILIYFANRPHGIVIKRNFPIILGWCMLVGLVVNVAIGIYDILLGGNNIDTAGDPDNPFGNTALTIPVVDLTANPFALRSLPPISMLVCGAMLTTQWFKARTLKEKRLFYIVMVLSVIGSILSGGRATLLFVLALFGIILLIQRRIGILIGLGCFGVVVFGCVNVVPDTVKSSPPIVRRALNWALIEKDAEASGNIASSSNWRLNLFNRALDEWRSDPRIFWFGRATYSYDVQDVIAFQMAGEDAIIESSLRRGATHNMITDLLVIFGLVGLVLYFIFYFAVVYFLWTLYRNRQLDELARTLALVSLISLAFNLAYGVLGGGNFPVIQSWFCVILIAYLYALNTPENNPTVAPKIEPPKGRQFSPRGPGGTLPARA